MKISPQKSQKEFNNNEEISTSQSAIQPHDKQQKINHRTAINKRTQHNTQKSR